jgi:putative membrane protein
MVYLTPPLSTLARYLGDLRYWSGRPGKPTVSSQAEGVLTEMMWNYYDGWSWLWMGGMMLLLWGGVIALVIWAIRAYSGPTQTGDIALETLRRRLAAGEISQEEFEKTKTVLQG